MDEACADSRRCLPAWMLKACSVNEASKTEDQNKQALESDKQPGALDQIKPVRRKSVRKVKTADKDDDGEMRALRQCKGTEKARRGKDVDHPVEDEFEEIENTIIKNVKKVSGRAVVTNSKKRKLGNVGSTAATASGTTDDEVELTVEDLVSIAEEIVHADKEKQQNLQATKTAVPYEDHQHPPIFTAADTGGSVVSSAQPMRGLKPCTTTSTLKTTPSECMVDKNNNHEEVQRPPSIQITGDVAQDMLNIFLGPLLSKPSSYGNKSRAIESVIMDAKHVPRQEDLRNEVERQGEPVKKKKSSLKDKVALFL